jgi:hypothetical protein
MPWYATAPSNDGELGELPLNNIAIDAARVTIAVGTNPI